MLHELLGLEAHKEPDVEKEKKHKKVGLFDIINGIYEKKPHPWFEIEKEYSAFMVNRALSQGMDTILFANEMNRMAHVDDQLQYAYFINNVGIRAKKRFNKWAKAAEAEDDIQLVMSHYNMNRRKAEEVIDLVDLESIRIKSDKGGINETHRNRRASKL
jgi:hypothetical protein